MAKMTLDESGRKYLAEIGLEPIGNRAILVEYAPNDNLGDLRRYSLQTYSCR